MIHCFPVMMKNVSYMFDREHAEKVLYANEIDGKVVVVREDIL